MKRVIVPVLSVFVVMSVSYLGYFGSRCLDGGTLQQWMAGFFGTTYFLSIAFGTLYVYTAAYVCGANLPQRITASLINPFIWMTKEVLRLTDSHPLLESLYTNILNSRKAAMPGFLTSSMTPKSWTT
ncbi:MAG: hypothetical protein JRH03_06085 [Deltaproteobacteria bacterium]|nr:hypothetical protein [Deltaproteobacteria bacterium]